MGALRRRLCVDRNPAASRAEGAPRPRRPGPSPPPRRSTRCSRPPTSSSKRRSRPRPTPPRLGRLGGRHRGLRRSAGAGARARRRSHQQLDDGEHPAPITPSTPRPVTRVVVERPAFNIRDYLWTGTIGLFAFLGQLAIVFFVTLFLLASGDTFRRKLVKLAGPARQTQDHVQALDEITGRSSATCSCSW